jgi:hypothetical protein
VINAAGLVTTVAGRDAASRVVPVALAPAARSQGRQRPCHATIVAPVAPLSGVWQGQVLHVRDPGASTISVVRLMGLDTLPHWQEGDDRGVHHDGGGGAPTIGVGAGTIGGPITVPDTIEIRKY